jgi:hypothetical protein
MPVQINEIIIRAIITNDDPKGKSGPSPAGKKAGESEVVNKTDILNLINEVLKSKKER